MQKEESDLAVRAKSFALQIIRLFSALSKTTEAQVIGKQVLRSGTSVGANFRHRNPMPLSSAARISASSGVSSTSGGRTLRHAGAARYDQIQTRVSAFHYRKAI